MRENRQFTRVGAVSIHNESGVVIRRSELDGRWRAEQATAHGIPTRIGTTYRRLSVAQAAVIGYLTS